MPLLIDQFFWGKRIHDLCLGPELRMPKKLMARSLAAVFTALKENTSYRENARRLAAMMALNKGVDSIYKAIEREMAGR